MVDPVLERAMDRIFTLHADHEQKRLDNRRCVWPRHSGGKPLSPALAAGIACLWGPAHGGANQACLEMLKEIGARSTASPNTSRAPRTRETDPRSGLMGFGHRVYKNFDPARPGR